MKVKRSLLVVEPLDDDVVRVCVRLRFLVANVAEVNAASSEMTSKKILSNAAGL